MCQPSRRPSSAFVILFSRIALYSSIFGTANAGTSTISSPSEGCGSRCRSFMYAWITVRRASDARVRASSRVSPRVCASGKPGKSEDLDITAVPHGFRSSFRDRMAEETDHPREVIETALAHVVRHNVEATDARSDLFGHRRPLDGPLGRLPRRLTAGAGVSVEVRRRFETELDGADGKMREPRRWPGRREHRRSGDPPSTPGPRAARGPPLSRSSLRSRTPGSEAEPP